MNRKYIRLNRICPFVRFPAQKLKMVAHIVFLDDFKGFMFLKDNLFFEIALPDFKYIVVESMKDITFLYGVYYYFMV